MTQKPMLNLGCGRVILPAPRPAHYAVLDNGICDYALWTNVDRNPEPGIDVVTDIFRYPWQFADNSFDGALCAHICEHIPHEIDTGVAHPGSIIYERYHALQDGWFAFFAELHRVLTPGSIIHVLSPYAWSSGGITDPTHTRLLTENSFTHSMQPDKDAPFAYATGGLNLELTEPVRLVPSTLFAHLLDSPEEWKYALQTRLNVANELYAQLRVVK